MDLIKSEESDAETDSESIIVLKSDEIINDLEHGNFTFDEKYKRMYEEHETLLECYNKICDELQSFNDDYEHFMDGYNYYYERINNYMNELENVFNYMIYLIKKEIIRFEKKEMDIKIDTIKNDIENIEKYEKLSELYEKLGKIIEIKMGNRCNNLIIDTKLAVEMADYKFSKMIEYFENNSVEGKNNIILFGSIIKSRKINENKKEEFKKIFMNFRKKNNVAYELLRLICLELLTDEKIKCKLSLLEYYYNINEKKEYHKKLNKYTVNTFLESLKESETEYNKDCPICFIENIKEKCITKCGHVYCLKCIKTYLDNKNDECPMCKQKLY
uniref:RING-type domain-containing protein n=1 Tax=viral metagenome TaxID=1070528 RepID=A0A6C0H5R9_9ZZZZ